MVVENLKKSLLDLIYSDKDKDLSTQTLRRRPPTHEFYEKVLIFELNRSGDLIDESEEEGDINEVYKLYLNKILSMFVYRQIFIDTIKAFYSESKSLKELKEYARRVLGMFIRAGVFETNKKIAFVIINNRKLLYINDEVINLETMTGKKLPFEVDSDILDPKNFGKYARPYPYSKVRVVYFGTYEHDKRISHQTRAVKIKFGYLTAVVDEDWEMVKLGGDVSEAELEYGLITFDELYTLLKNKYVKQMLLYVYDKLSPTAKRSIDAMTRKRNELFENMVLYLSNVSLSAKGVYMFKYRVVSKEKKEGIVFFVQMGGVRRINVPTTNKELSYTKSAERMDLM